MRRLFAPLSLLAAASALAAGCGAAASQARLPAPSAALVARSESATAAAHTARVWIHTVSSSVDGRFETTSTGVVTLSAPFRGRLATRIALPRGTGVVRAKELVTWREMYVASPIYLPAANGRPWLVVDVARARRRQMQLFGGLDPFQALDVLRFYDVHAVRSLGSESVRGVPTVHLGLELGTTRYPAEVWIDAEGLLRRARFLPPPTAEGDRWEATIDLWQFGAPLTFRVPPQGSVTRRDITDLRAMAQWPAWHQ